MQNSSSSIPAGNIGFWETDTRGLPVFRFTAPLPVETIRNDRVSIPDPGDPWFILGNYGFTCFIHTSGVYSIMSLERAIARLNYAENETRCSSSSCISITAQGTTEKYLLSGLSSAMAVSSETGKRFGCGSAEFTYMLPNGIRIIRKLTTPPSRSYQDRISGMYLSYELFNEGGDEIQFSVTERLTARYDMAFWHNAPCRRKGASYPVRIETHDPEKTVKAIFKPGKDIPLAFTGQDDLSLAEGYPAVLCFTGSPAEGTVFTPVCELTGEYSAEIGGTVSGSLSPGEHAAFGFAAGYEIGDELSEYTWEDTIKRLLPPSAVNRERTDFSDEWLETLPLFTEIENEQTRLEMIWHAYVLEAMANWNEHYRETFIPQGTVYEYNLGVAACIRDHLQHALPLCHYNPDLAKSILRFTMKKTDYRGDILHTDEGAGNFPIGGDIKSDNQIYFFMALAEYLNATEDGGFLVEFLPFRGPYDTPGNSVLDRIRRCFLYLRDVVSTGDHGLIRMLCADWNDCLYSYFREIPYHRIFSKGESHLNTAMAVSVFTDLIRALENVRKQETLDVLQEEINELVTGMAEYREELLEALLRDWGEAPFIKRAYIGTEHELGGKSMIYEPQPHVLALEDIPAEKRKALWKEIRNRLYDSEKKGARQAEVPLGSSDAGGSRENGGFWYALNGPLIRGLLTIAPEEAEQAAQKMTLAAHAEQFPGYWVGMWSGPDSYDSSLLPSEGMSSAYTREFPVFCAHAHAWPLYSLIKISEYKGNNKSQNTNNK